MIESKPHLSGVDIIDHHEIRGPVSPGDRLDVELGDRIRATFRVAASGGDASGVAAASLDASSSDAS